METAAEYTSASAESSQPAPAAVPGAETAATTELPAVEAGAEAVTPESQSAAVEGDQKKNHQKTLEERAEEIADRKIQQRIQEAQQRQQEQEQLQPDFISVDYNAYNAHVARLIAAERQIQDEISIDPDNATELVLQLRKVIAERSTYEQQFEENEKKRAAWEEKNQQAEKQQQSFQQTQAQINAVIAEIPKAHGISPEALDAGRKFMNEAFQKDPSLQNRFNSIINHEAMYQGFSGVAAAVDWAVTYAKENMGKAAVAAVQQREAGKELTIGSEQSASGVFGSVNSYADLLKLPSKQINQFAKEHPQKYQNFKQKHFR